MKNLKPLLIASCIGFAANASAQDLVVDLFAAADGSTDIVCDAVVAAQCGGISTDTVSVAGGADILGGAREIEVDVSASTALVSTSFIEVSGGNLRFSVPDATTAEGSILWDGDATLGNQNALGQDLTGGLFFSVEIIKTDLAFPFALSLTGDTTADFATIFFTGQDTAPPAFTETIAIDAFGFLCDGVNDLAEQGAAIATVDAITAIQCGGSGVDLTNVGSISAGLNVATNNSDALGQVAGELSVDLRLGIIKVVPVPGTLALMGLGLIGLASRRKKAS